MLVDINLLPEKEKERSTLLLAALTIIGVAILIWITLFFIAQSYSKQSIQLEQQQSSLLTQQDAVRDTLQVSEFAADKRALVSTVNWAENYQFDTIPLLAGLVRLLPERGFFDEFEFVGPNSAILMVQFNTTNEAAYYLTRIQAAEFIDGVSLESVRAEEIDDLDEEIETTIDIYRLPRYLAVYNVRFFDERIVIESPIEDEDVVVDETPVEGGDQDD